MDTWRQELAEARKVTDFAVAVRKEQVSHDMDRMEMDVAKMFGSQQDSLKAGLQEVFRREVNSRSVPAGTSDGSVEFLDMYIMYVFDGAEKAVL